jgi:hypothetical protein
MISLENPRHNWENNMKIDLKTEGSSSLLGLLDP